MSTHRDIDTGDQGLAHPGTVHPDLADLGRPTIANRVWGVTRITLGLVFFWAFVDKLFGLGFATPSERSWLSGGSPTAGFLGGVEGPFSGVYTAIAGQAWADWLFMLGLLGIGVALLVGVAMRFAAAAGALLLVLMWTALLPMVNNPVIDDHLVYAIVLVGLAAAGAGHTFGLGRRWERLAIVRRFPVLR
ncbi:MAG: DoxX family membrane protein [Nocardioides sp.]|nr:DoxX family membrane protein [Nocardioides sp.]